MKESFLWDKFFDRVSSAGGGITLEPSDDRPHHPYVIRLGKIEWYTSFPCYENLFEVMIRYEADRLSRETA